jgi:hypothetical protein
MSPELLQLQVLVSHDRAQTRRHGHTINEVRLRRPGLLGAFLVSPDQTRPVLVWRSTSWR